MSVDWSTFFSLLLSRAKSRPCPCGNGIVHLLNTEKSMISGLGFEPLFTCERCRKKFEEDGYEKKSEDPRNRELKNFEHDIADLPIEMEKITKLSLKIDEKKITAAGIPLDVKKLIHMEKNGSRYSVCKNRFTYLVEYYPSLLRGKKRVVHIPEIRELRANIDT